ncbi:hypothetical protein LDC_0761 [sediment metagenome]|uniref:Uncharacterized protein n=1 Tax=sediment metagenome TaxID=749907 RepID=D9PGW4_9ZZZZ
MTSSDTRLNGPPMMGGIALGLAMGYVPCLYECETGVCSGGPGGPLVTIIGTTMGTGAN